MPVRTVADACPGVFAPHDAADGALARIRLPGGVISATALRAVADCADDLGDGHVHLTSRGNLQLRGLSRSGALPARLAAAGLLPSVTHERVRNVLASPLSGIDGGGDPVRRTTVDVRGLAAELDRELCARPGLAELPGRFLFALDDGRGDVAAEDPDLCWRAGVLLVAGTAVGQVPAAGAVTALLAAAEVFLALRAEASGAADGGAAWRAAELTDVPARLGAALASLRGLRPPEHGGSAPLPAAPAAATPAAATPTTTTRAAATTAATPGPVRRADGGVALVVAPVLGELTADQFRLLADALSPTSDETAVVTPWRTIVLPDPRLPTATFAAAGLLVGPDPAAAVSACAGRPGCAKALADVRADARAALGRLPEGRVHVSGCARRCGAPRGAFVDAVALDGGGYLVDGVPRSGLAT